MSVPRFSNEPLTDFSRPATQERMRAELSAVRAEFGQSYALSVGGRPVNTGSWINSINPSAPDETVGKVAKAGRREVDAALDAAAQAFPSWRRVPPAARARVLFKAAAMLRRQKFHFSALEVYEAGKTWSEADADVAEAIDFLEYYGRSMADFAGPVRLHPLAGEEDEAFWIPLGVGAVIPPWNFPLAILAGMSAAPVVAGNAIVLKPSSNTPVIGAQFAALMAAAGLPDGVLNFLPGDGDEVGDYLVGHPKTRFISFTGSREIGLRINQLAAVHAQGQKWLKRVVAEMGGKDAIIVDETADLAAAAAAIVASAFGFSGQKCSACSRAVLVEAVHDTVLAKVVELTQKLTVGPAENPDNALGPVIDQRAEAKILEYIDWGKENARLEVGGEKLAGSGYFLAPTIFSGVRPQSRLEQEEIFGPVLSVIRAKDWVHALDIANDTEYGLTGAIFTRRRDRVETAREAFEVGNLYINRKCTGAMVGAHPFGGFNLSGTNSKTGSPGYLQLFLQMKAVAEKF